MMLLDISDMRCIILNAFTLKNQFVIYDRPKCLEKTLFTILLWYIKLFWFYYLTCYICIVFLSPLLQPSKKENFCTIYLNHLNEQMTLQKHKLYCQNEVEIENLIDGLRATSGYSQEVKKASMNRVRRYLQRLEV